MGSHGRSEGRRKTSRDRDKTNSLKKLLGSVNTLLRVAVLIPTEELWRKRQGMVESLMLEWMRKSEVIKRIKGRRKRKSIRPVSPKVKIARMIEGEEEIRKRIRGNPDLDQVSDEDEIEARKRLKVGKEI